MTRTLRPPLVARSPSTPFLVSVFIFLLSGLLAGMALDVVPALPERVGHRRRTPLLAGVLALGVWMRRSTERGGSTAGRGT